MGLQYFSASIPGISVGDSFVDNNGFCWRVTDTTPLPSTYSVTADTVYASSLCGTCTDANVCPDIYDINSCCGLGKGYSTLDLIGGGVASGDIFVDQFGFCWSIGAQKSNGIGLYANLSFINAVTIYSPDCAECIKSNACPSTLYYTIQNCCDESVEVVSLNSSYGADTNFILSSAEKAGAYRVISWSDTGTATLTSVDILDVTGEGPCYSNGFLDFYYCPGSFQCCNTWSTESGGPITGYGCDGTWYYNETFPALTEICMAWVETKTSPSWISLKPCCFQVHNPSMTIDGIISYTECEVAAREFQDSIPGNSTSVFCMTCLNNVKTQYFKDAVQFTIVNVGPPTCIDPFSK